MARGGGILGALLGNESGGRNIPNVHQGTDSGQAQGYFQITTGTWDDFGGKKYAPNPLQATYEQQAEIASKIPLKRWDKSTLAAMSRVGKINPNLTLGENLAMHGESFNGAVTQPVKEAQPVAAPKLRYSLYGGAAARPDSISGFNPGFTAALEQLYAAAPPEIQKELGITSGYRSKAVQQALWDASDKSGKMVARPGHSKHESGTAADLYGMGLGS